jgi:hypothetical protein
MEDVLAIFPIHPTHINTSTNIRSYNSHVNFLNTSLSHQNIIVHLWWIQQLSALLIVNTQNYYFAQDNRLRRACIDCASRFARQLRQTMGHKKLLLLELGNLQAKTPWLPW